jgi:hypothetical protein
MPKPIRLILITVLAVGAIVATGGCGSSGQPGEQPASSPPAPQAGATKTPDPGSADDVTAEPSLREAVRADVRQIMADIRAAERRGDVVDGVPVGESSNPYDYVGISPAFTRLVALGEPALPAIAAEIEASEDDGLREYLLAAAGAQISGDTPGSGAQTWSSGKEWARQYRESH